MTDLWETENLWKIYGKHVGNLCEIHGIYGIYENRWEKLKPEIYGLYGTWKICGKSMGNHTGRPPPSYVCWFIKPMKTSLYLLPYTIEFSYVGL